MAAPAPLDMEVEKIINEGLQAYLSGKRTAEQAAKEIDEKVTLFLNE
jgi:ABC-type glycerol-3-phosphate transport system substrate-binding protein